MDLIPTIVLIGIDTNEALVTVIIDWGIITSYNDIDVISSILKYEALT